MFSFAAWFSVVCEEEFDLGSPCTQRRLIDMLNIFFIIIYSINSLSSCFRGQNSNRSRQRTWDFIIISTCCALTAISYFSAGVRALVHKEYKSMNWNWLFNYLITSIIWAGLSLSLILQPTKLVQNLSLVWWTSFPLVISAHNLTVLLKDHHNLQVLDILSWSASFLLLFCSIKLIVQRHLHKGNLEQHGLSQPFLTQKSTKNATPAEVGLISRLTFSWLNPLLRVGYSKPLQLDDIPPLGLEDSSLFAYQKFIQVWNLQVSDKGKSSDSVSWALAKCYLADILITGFYAFLKTLANSVSPILLYAFVRYSYLEERNIKLGLVLVALLVMTKLAESLSQRHWFFESRRLGMRMRSALMAAIFEKMLKLSSHGRRRHSTGEVVNYIAVDAYRLGDFPAWFHMVWSLPLQLLFSVGILFWAVGLGALPGLVPLIILGILNVPFAKILQNYQSKFMPAQDERLRATSEALNNMKIIKLQSWEEHFRKMVESLRDAEFKWLSEIQNNKAWGSALYWICPTIVSAVIFAGTAAMGTAPLDAGTIFTVLATLRVMSEPVRMLPEVLSIMIQVKVSLDRINVFLLEDEIKEEDVKRNQLQDSNLSLQVQSGTFGWESIHTLKNLNLTVNRGEKIAVCGPVGSGKSSLLYAVLGEVTKLSGTVSQPKKISTLIQ